MNCAQEKSPEPHSLMEVFMLNPIQHKPAPEGYTWVYCRYRRVRNSDRMLDAHEYGYQAWVFLVKVGKR